MIDFQEAEWQSMCDPAIESTGFQNPMVEGVSESSPVLEGSRPGSASVRQ